MSDAKVETKSKTPKAESTSAAKTADKATPEKSASVKSGDGGGGAVGKSARESIGGAKEVHYGYFSNVKTPEYLEGWGFDLGQQEKYGTKEAGDGETCGAQAARAGPFDLGYR